MKITDTSMPNAEIKPFSVPEGAPFSTRFSAPKPKILLLYGSLLQRSFSRLVTEENTGQLMQPADQRSL